MPSSAQSSDARLLLERQENSGAYAPPTDEGIRPYVVRAAAESLLAAHSALSATTGSSSVFNFSSNG
jgi:hypothetical protein